MASKMKKKEIEEFIKSKSTTQDTYIAPTVRTHVDAKAPAMVQVAQTVKPTIGQTAGYIGKAAKTGLVGGVTSVPTSNLQEIEGGLKKGKNIKNIGDVAKQIVNSLSTISNITNPLSMQNVLNTASNMSKSTKKALKDKNKDALSKALSIGTAAVSNAADMANPTHQLAESVFPLVGAVDKKSDQKVRNLIDTINKPNEKLQQELAKESQNHGKVANMVASGVQAATNMIPSLAATAITKNPNIGMAVMANNVKGQATEEALKQGKSLEEAREIGNVRAAAEVATEMLSGGLANIYGKGATDDVAKNIIDRYIQNPTANFLATKASGIVGENVEESLSNILNKAIDKGTVDPNAKITMNDITEPWGPTTISTLLLNGATGDYSRASFNQNAAQLQAQSPITKVQNMNDVERNALTEITMKRKQGIPLDENDMATINYLNNRDNVVTEQNVQDNELRVEPVDTKTNKEVTKTNDLNEYIEDVATREALQNENDKNAIKQSITEYLEDNNITNPTKEDMLNAMDDYNMMDNAEDITDLRKAQRLYNEVADEMLKESPKVEEKVETTKSNKFKNLTTTDEARLNKIYDIQRKGEKLSQNQIEELEYFKRKEQGLKFPELTKSDTLNKTDYAKYYAKANMDNGDATRVNKAKDIVQPNKQGRRTKQQWLDIAENIGNQASNMDAESLKKYAYESFKEARPNQTENLNRQGEKYVKFGVQEWVNSVYDGAGVGTKNIAEKKADSVITVRNNKGQELKLKQDKTNPNVYEKEVKVPKDNKSIVPKETMQKQLAKLKDGTKVSNFYSNLTENSKFITQENASKLSQEEIWRYAPQTNKETMANAEARIGDTQKSLESAYGDFLSKNENFSPEDVGVGWILLKRFQDAGNYDAMVQVAKKMRNIATKSGQTVQMFNLQSRLTPEGMVKYAQSELMEAEQQFNKGKSQKEIDKYAKDFELTGEEVEFIKNQMEKIQGMEDGRAKNIEMAKINKMLSDKLPHQRGDSIKAWMRMSMLFNPKTQVRNVVGNALITPINALADVPASIADKAISKKTGTRTIGAPSLSGLATYGKGFAKGGVEAWQDYRMGLDTKDVDMSRFDITQKNPFVTDHKGAARALNPISKGLNKANSFLDLVMSGGDRVFYQGAFDASLRNQMELNNVKTPTQDMIDIATQEALARTWNDNNGYTQFVLNTRRALNKASIGGYGLGDVLIPFAKTPANLTKAIYDYSPVGLTTTLFKTKSINNAIETGQITAQMQHDFAQNLGKGVAGTMLYAMAYALAKAGIATGSSDDDKDVANFIKNTMGIQPYSIKIGDKSFTYDWAQPVAAPIAIASDAYQNLTRDSDEDTATRIFNTILDVSNTGFNVLMQQSFLQGISEVLNSNEGVANGIIEQVIGLPARAVPTFVQQINNMFDKTQRVAFEKNQPLKTGKQNVMSKLPGQSQRLAPRVDALGNEVQRYGDSESDLTYALKNFLSPANQSNRKTSKAASEIYDVYEATGDKTIMPMVAPYYIQNKTVGRIDLDSKDRATYQKISGKLINDAVVELTNDADYNKLSYDEKAEVLNGVVSYANAKAKEHFTGFMANTYNPANKKINNGMSIADYYLEKTMNKR